MAQLMTQRGSTSRWLPTVVTLGLPGMAPRLASASLMGRGRDSHQPVWLKLMMVSDYEIKYLTIFFCNFMENALSTVLIPQNIPVLGGQCYM